MPPAAALEIMGTSRLSDLMRKQADRLFVGRSDEQARFEGALLADPPSFHVLHVYGPGGIGKTTLLDRFAATAARQGVETVTIDGRSVDPLPAAVETMLTDAGAFGTDAPLVALIDTYEQLERLDDWFRAEVVPRLSDRTMLVVSGRNGPSTGWRSDAALWALCATMPLRRLADAESQAYLERRGVAADRRANVLAFTHGHPLALSLAADVIVNRPDDRTAIRDAPDIIGALLERLRIDAPDELHRLALETAAVVPEATESLLENVIPEGDAAELFRWLASLSIMSRASVGVAPHDLARHAVASDLRWRHPVRYREIHARTRDHFSSRVAATSGVEQDRMVRGLMYLHRDNPAIAPFLDWDTMAQHRQEPVQPLDVPALVAMVQRHEGEASATLASAYLDSGLDDVVVIRGGDAEPEGFVLMVRLTYAEVAAGVPRHDDPASAAALATLAEHWRLRPGETATLFRFWMSRDDHQLVSGVQSALFAVIVRHYLATPRLAVTLLPVADPDFWAPGLAYADLERHPAADFTVGDRSYGVFAHDWRVRPPAAWLGMLADRETSGRLEPPMERPEPVVVMSETDLKSAVSAALANMARPDRLGDSALLRSRVVIDAAAPGTVPAERTGTLVELLTEAIEDLAVDAKGTKQNRALYHTYVNPAPTQEAAAEAAGMPFSTYRRHLVAGRAAVAERIWRLDLGES